LSADLGDSLLHPWGSLARRVCAVTRHMGRVTVVRMFSVGHLDGLLVTCSRKDGTLRNMFVCGHECVLINEETTSGGASNVHNGYF
jgi:hypothetical protein